MEEKQEEKPTDLAEEKKEIVEVPNPLSPLDKAEEMVQRLEKANKESKDLIRAVEKLQADTMIMGRSFAGQRVEKTEEEKIRDEANVFANALGRKI